MVDGGEEPVAAAERRRILVPLRRQCVAPVLFSGSCRLFDLTTTVCGCCV